MWFKKLNTVIMTQPQESLVQNNLTSSFYSSSHRRGWNFTKRQRKSGNCQHLGIVSSLIATEKDLWAFPGRQPHHYRLPPSVSSAFLLTSHDPLDQERIPPPGQSLWQRTSAHVYAWHDMMLWASASLSRGSISPPDIRRQRGTDTGEPHHTDGRCQSANPWVSGCQRSLAPSWKQTPDRSLFRDPLQPQFLTFQEILSASWLHRMPEPRSFSFLGGPPGGPCFLQPNILSSNPDNADSH